MKAEITIYCDNEQELRGFVASVLSKPAPFVRAEPRDKTPDETQAIAAEVINAAQVQPFAQQAAQEAAPPDTIFTAPPVENAKRIRKPRSDAGQPRAPYKTTGETAPDPTPVQSSGDETAAPTTTAEGKALVYADVFAALKRIHDIKGLATPGTMAQLKDFGVQKISDLKPEDYARFIESADAKIAEFLKAQPAA